jgi:hypothetical protein
MAMDLDFERSTNVPLDTFSRFSQLCGAGEIGERQTTKIYTIPL